MLIFSCEKTRPNLNSPQRTCGSPFILAKKWQLKHLQTAIFATSSKPNKVKMDKEDKYESKISLRLPNSIEKGQSSEARQQNLRWHIMLNE